MDNLEKNFKNGTFSIVIEKTILRWYDGNSSLSERRERDKYQVMKDLSREEMEAIKVNEYNLKVTPINQHLYFGTINNVDIAKLSWMDPLASQVISDESVYVNVTDWLVLKYSS